MAQLSSPISLHASTAPNPQRSLRMYLPFTLFAMRWPFLSAYVPISWLCWVPNLIVAEWIIRRRWAIATV